MSQQPEGTVPKPESEQLNIKVKDSDGHEVFFKVKKHTKLSKLQRAYADRMGKPLSTIRFLFDGQRINEDDTAETLEMEDGDEIDAMVEQLVSVRDPSCDCDCAHETDKHTLRPGGRSSMAEAIATNQHTVSNHRTISDTLVSAFSVPSPRLSAATLRPHASPHPHRHHTHIGRLPLLDWLRDKVTTTRCGCGSSFLLRPIDQ